MQNGIFGNLNPNGLPSLFAPFNQMEPSPVAPETAPAVDASQPQGMPLNPFSIPLAVGINGQRILEGAANNQVVNARNKMLGVLGQAPVEHPTMQSYKPSKGDMLAMALIGLAGNLSAPNSNVGTQAINTWMSMRDARAQKEWQNAEILARNAEAQQQQKERAAQFEYNSAINQREDLQTQVLRQEQRQDRQGKDVRSTLTGMLDAIDKNKSFGQPGAAGAAFDRAYAYAKSKGLADEFGLTPNMREAIVRESAGILYAKAIKPTYDAMLKTAKSAGELTDEGAKKINDWLDEQKKYYGIPDDFNLPYVESFTTQARKAATIRQDEFAKTFGLKEKDFFNKWAYNDSMLQLRRSQLQINWQNANTFYENAITNRERADAYVSARRLKTDLDKTRKSYTTTLQGTQKALAKYQGFQSQEQIDKALELLDSGNWIAKQAFEVSPKDFQKALMQYKWARDWLNENPVDADPEGFDSNPVGDLAPMQPTPDMQGGPNFVDSQGNPITRGPGSVGRTGEIGSGWGGSVPASGFDGSTKPVTITLPAIGMASPTKLGAKQKPAPKGKYKAPSGSTFTFSRSK